MTWKNRLIVRARKKKDAFITPLAQQLIRLNVSANQLSVLGGLVGLSATFFLQQQSILVFFVLALIWRLFDGIDGTVARCSSKKTWWIDPFIDRIVGMTYLVVVVVRNPSPLLFTALVAYVIFGVFRFLFRIPTMLFPEDVLIILYVFGFFQTAGLIILICSAWNLKETIIYLRTRS